jgi:hypothetical protein
MRRKGDFSTMTSNTGFSETLATSVALIERWSGGVQGARLIDVVTTVASADASVAHRATDRAEVLFGALGPSSMRLAAEWLREGVRAIDYRLNPDMVDWMEVVMDRLGSSSDAGALGRTIQELLGLWQTSSSSIARSRSSRVSGGVFAEGSASVIAPSSGRGGSVSISDDLAALPFDQDAGLDADASVTPMEGLLEQCFDDEGSVDLDGPSDEDDE